MLPVVVLEEPVAVDLDCFAQVQVECFAEVQYDPRRRHKATQAVDLINLGDVLDP